MSKRAAQGAGTIRKKTVTRNGKPYTYWEARVTTGVDPGTGKQLQRSFSGKTQKEVREKLQSAAVEVNRNDYCAPSKLTVAQWCGIWLSDYMADKKYSTVKHYRAQCNTHIIPALGAVNLQSLTSPQIQTFYNTLQISGAKVPKKDGAGKIMKSNGVTVYERRPLSPKSIKNVHVVLSKCLSTAVSVGYLRSNPDRAVLPKITGTEIHPLTDAQVKLFLSAADEDPLSPILKTILFTGMREGEALGLTWDCVDFEAGTIKIDKQLQKRPKADGGYVLTSPKNGKTRTIKPAVYVMDILHAAQMRQIEDRMKAAEYWEGWSSENARKTSLVFLNPLGNEISPKALYLHYKKIARGIGVPDSRVHDLRHTYAVMAIQTGDDIKTVQQNLGHASAAFTLDVYGHVSDRMRDDSSTRMQNYILSLQTL